MAGWTVEDLRKAQLPDGAPHALLVATVQHLQRRDPRLAELILEQAQLVGGWKPKGRLPPGFKRWLERWREQMALQCIEDFERKNLSRGKQKPRTRWPWRAALVSLIAERLREFSQAQPGATEAQLTGHLTPIWRQTLHQTGPLPPELVRRMQQTKTHEAAAREMVSRSEGVDVETLRQNILPILRKIRQTVT